MLLLRPATAVKFYIVQQQQENLVILNTGPRPGSPDIPLGHRSTSLCILLHPAAQISWATLLPAVGFYCFSSVILEAQITRSHVKYLRYKYEISMDDIKNLSKLKLKEHCYTKWLAKVDPLYPMYAGIIKEMILMTESRNDFIVNNVIVERWLSNEQCKHIIDSLCTI